MSPPARYGVSFQEGLGVKNISDLDNADTHDEKYASCNLAVVLKGAVEHHEYPSQIKEKYESKVTKEVDEYKKDAGSPEDCYEEGLQLVDLRPNGCVVNCLNENNEDLLDEEQAIVEDPNLTARLPENESTVTIRKRKKKKTNKKHKAKKRRRISGCLKSGLVFTENPLANARGSTTKHSGSKQNGQCESSVATGAVRTVMKQSNGSGGGGGGDGGGDGGDGDDPRKGNKYSAHNSSFPDVKLKKNKKSGSGEQMEVDESSSHKMEVEESSSSHGSPMVDSSMPKEADAHMGTGNEEDERPKEKSPEHVKDVNMKLQERVHAGQNGIDSQQFLVKMHTRINHYSGCKLPSCQKCNLVKRIIHHFASRKENGCRDCRDCTTWLAVLQFHEQICRLQHCRVCPSAHAHKHVPKIVPNRHDNNAYVEHLNVPTSGLSLDEEVIYRDCTINSTLTHFKEHCDYTLKSADAVGKGGNGTVHDIVIHNHIKEKHVIFKHQEFVVKKTKNLGEDELAVIKATRNHPNFVKTFVVVVKKAIGEHRIVMEKCGVESETLGDVHSLKDYLKALEMKGQPVNINEAMYFWIQVLDAVVFLHTQRIPIVHKDIKSNNVLLTQPTNFMRAKLADFDTAKLLHNEYTQPGLNPRGTRWFTAPEVMNRHAHGRPADIYSLAKLLLELLAISVKEKSEDAIKKLKLIDAGLAKMVEQCLQENPEDRPTAVDLRDCDIVRRFSNIVQLDNHPN